MPSKSWAALLAVCCGVAAVAYTASRPGGLFTPTLPSPAVQDDLALTLRNPGVVLRLGLPDFVGPADESMGDALRLLTDVLRDDLDFEHEYRLIPRAASALVPGAPASALPIASWANLGADLVLTGGVRPDGTHSVITLQLVSVRPSTEGQVAFKADYSCVLATTASIRACAHEMADAFHLATRALVGVARTRLAFVSDRDHERLASRPSSDSVASATELYTADYDGANQARATTLRSITCCPSWSPATHALAFVSWAFGPPDVFHLALNDRSSPPTRLAKMGGGVQSWSPAWSPDGRRVAFASNRSGNLDVWVVNADGSDLRNLTNHPAADGTPTWSPDGGQIAFASNRSGANYLYVMSAEGSAPRILLNEKIDRPSWSTANFIVFTLEPHQGRHRIGRYDVDTGSLTPLTDGSSDDENPVVSPNGRHVAFVTTRWGGEHIAVMDRTGANVRRVTTVGRNVYPAWEPGR